MTTNQNEFDANEWREIPGFHGLYIISNKGVVRSVDRHKYDTWARMGQRFVKGKEIIPTDAGAVRLRNYKNGLPQYKRIDHLMRDVWGVYDFE